MPAFYFDTFALSFDVLGFGDAPNKAVAWHGIDEQRGSLNGNKKRNDAMKISRRKFAKLAASTTMGAALNPTAWAATPEKSKKPNILLIMTDQQHRKMMSCTGNQWLETPALDGLAGAGIRFDGAYCTNPVCVPSRMSMATGVMPCRIGATSNKPGMSAKLEAEIDTNSLGKLLKRAGYDTFYGGKVHMCPQLHPRNAGYDIVTKDDRNKLPDDCIKFMKVERKSPFFAVASFINPHDICFAHVATKGKGSADMLSLYEKAKALPLENLTPLPENYDLPENEPGAIADRPIGKATTPSMLMRKTYDDRAWRINRWIYHRLTEKVDRNIGRILDGLKQAGLEDNTLIIFTSDHGNMDASHRLASKGIIYEESVGVPMIMKYNGHITSNKVNKTHLVSTGLDILPTICDYAGIEKPNHCLGHSLRPLAEGSESVEWRSYVAAENATSRMIRSQRYKYCAFSDPKSKELLVDMDNDPGEMRNLVDDPALKDTLEQHRKLLADWAKLSGDGDFSLFIRSG